MPRLCFCLRSCTLYNNVWYSIERPSEFVKKNALVLVNALYVSIKIKLKRRNANVNRVIYYNIWSNVFFFFFFN
jgi:hypothetical protein